MGHHVQPQPMLTVVIPTLDEADHLPALLASLASAPDLIACIIVSDGGSTDATVPIARAAGAVIVVGDAGRGGQFRRGIARAPSPWLLLLHADSSLPQHWPMIVRQCLNEPARAWYGRLRFAIADPRARVLEIGTWLRCALLRLPYGDQGLLIHRDLLEAVGGMPDLVLMEDVALARALGRRLAPMDLLITTDASAYVRDGWIRRAARNLARLIRYRFGAVRVTDYRR